MPEFYSIVLKVQGENKINFMKKLLSFLSSVCIIGLGVNKLDEKNYDITPSINTSRSHGRLLVYYESPQC